MERPEYIEMMTLAKYKPGDIVWTNVKTYSPWPGKVLHVSDDILKIYPDNTKILHYIEFYMKKDRDFLPEDELCPFDDDQGKFSTKKRSLLFHQAVNAAKEDANFEFSENSIIDVENAPSYGRLPFLTKSPKRSETHENVQITSELNEGLLHSLSSNSNENDLSASILKPCGSSKLVQNNPSSKVDFVPSKRLFNRSSAFGRIKNKNIISQDVYEFSESDSLVLSMGSKPSNALGSMRHGAGNMDMSFRRNVPELDRSSKSKTYAKPPPMNINFKRKRPSMETMPESTISSKPEGLNKSIDRVAPKAESRVGDQTASFDISMESKIPKIEEESATRLGKNSRKRQSIKKHTSGPTVDRGKSNELLVSENETKVMDLPIQKSAPINRPDGKAQPNEAVQEKPETKAKALSSHMLLAPRIGSPLLNERRSVGFLGLGGLGKKIVRRLVADGHEVTLWNRSLYKCYEMVDMGVQTKSTAEQVVTSCDVTFCCVTHTAAVKEVFYSPTGALSGIREGKSFVVLTTIDPKVSSDIEAAVKSKGGLYLESPMFPAGGTIIDNNLLTVVGGSQSCLRVCVPYFRSFVKDLFYVGDVPEGNKMILLMKTLSGVKIAALAESMALAEKCDVPTDILFQVVKQTQIASPFLISKAETMLGTRPNSEDDVFPLAHFSNDLSSTLNLTSELDTPVFAAAKQVFLHSKLRGYSQHDVSAVYLKYTEPF